jgi:TRAP-type mannitol/chloroaromatic compound transport system substrate-binding protein
MKAIDTQKQNVDRRGFLKGMLAAGAAGTAALTFPVVSHAQTRTLALQTNFVKGDILYEFGVDYTKLVNSMSGGALRIDPLDPGKVTAGPATIDAVNAGTVDAGIGVANWWDKKHNAFNLFGTAPAWGWGTNEFLGWMRYGGGQVLYDELLNGICKLNLVSFMFGPMPNQPFGWFKKEVQGANELKGLKYRTLGIAADMSTAIGMNVNPLPGGKLASAIESGELDGAEFNNPMSDNAVGLPKVAKVCMLQSYHQPCECFDVLYNKTSFDSLPKETREILRIAASAASADMAWKAMDLYSTALEELQKSQGVKMVKTPDDILAAQLKGWDKVIADMSAQNAFFKKVVESQKAWAKRVVGFSLRWEVNQRMAYEHNFGKL